MFYMNVTGKLLVGAARADITPLEEMLPLHYVETVNFEKVADRISARVIYLENGGSAVLLVNLDLAEVPYAQETMDALAEMTGLSQERIFISPIHTHSMPFFGTMLAPPKDETEPAYRRYYAYVMEAVKTAVRTAMAEKRPAKLGYGEGRSYINVNRDEKVDGKYTYGVNYERPSDKTLRLVRLDDMDGNMIALLVNYAVHAVVTNGCMIGDGLWIGGDLPGRTETMLEEKLGGVVLWMPAASADQNPRVVSNFGYDLSSPTLRTISLGEGGYLVLESLAKEHVRDIIAANETITCDMEDAKIAASEKNVFVPAKEAVKAAVPVVPFTLKLLRIGSLAIEGVSAEVATTVGKALCDLSDAEHTLMVTHVQGTSWYVPDDWEYEEHAQEVDESLIERGCAEPVFTKAFQEMLAETR